MSILFYYQSYFFILGKSDRNDTLRRYLTNVNVVVVVGALRLDWWISSVKGRERISDLTIAVVGVGALRLDWWISSLKGRVRISALNLAVKTDLFAYFKQ